MFKTADGYELKVGDKVYQYDIQEINYPWIVKDISLDGKVYVDDLIGEDGDSKRYYCPIEYLYKYKESIIIRYYNNLCDEIKSLNDNYSDILKYRCFADKCFKKTDWLRCTQFSGKHHYCDEHAKLQSDFNDCDQSYFYWVKIEDYKKIKKKR